MKKLYKFLPLLVIVAAASIIWSSGAYRYVSLETLRLNQEFLDEFVADNLWLSAAIYSAVYFSVVSLSIPVATVMTLVGGFLFGQWVGVVCVVISASLGGCVIFLSTKFASKISKNDSRKEAGKWVKKMQKGFAENAFSYMLTLRLIPIIPFVIVNLVAGILQIPLRIFFFGTLIGIIPASFIYVSVGVAMRELLNQPGFTAGSLLEPKIALSLTGLGILALLPIIYKKYFKRRK